MRKKGFVDNAIAMRHRNVRDRILVLKHYSDGSMSCACCGIDEFSFLSIDHVDGGGNAERVEKLGNKFRCGHHMYRLLIQNRFPTGYQVLCMNCQVGRRDNGGVCPCPGGSKSLSADELLSEFDKLRVGNGNFSLTETDEYKEAFARVQRKQPSKPA